MTPLRIAVDARELEGRPTGVGRYLAELLRGWATAAPEVVPTLYTCGPLDPPVPGLRVVPLPAPSGTVWLEAALPRRLAVDRPDAVFGPAYVIPRGTAPGIVALHDLSFEAEPRWFPLRERVRRQTLARLAASRASLILCCTETMREEIEARYAPPAPVRAVPLGVGPTFSAPPGDARIDALTGETSRPVLAFSGSLFNRRHPGAILETAARVFQKTGAGTLLLAGENRTWPKFDVAGMARGLGIAPRVRELGFVDDATLRALLAATDVFLWPSDYEGFGLPPLEAMAAGVPVVATASPVLAEVLGDAATLLPRPDPAAMAEAVLALLEDRPARERQIRRGRERAAVYTWEHCARETLLHVRASLGRP